MEKLFNGDIRLTNVVQHYCRGCCKSRNGTLLKMQTYGLDEVIPKGGVGTLSRSNWVGAEEAMDDVGLGSGIHDLLPASWLACHPLPKRRAAPGDGEPVVPAVLDRADDAEHPEDGGADEAPLVDKPDDAVDDNAPKAEQQLKPISIWRDEKINHISSTSTWFASGRASDDLFLGRKHNAEYSHLIKSQMKITNTKWDREQQALLAEGKSGRTRWTWFTKVSLWTRT